MMIVLKSLSLFFNQKRKLIKESATWYSAITLQQYELNACISFYKSFTILIKFSNILFNITHNIIQQG